MLVRTITPSKKQVANQVNNFPGHYSHYGRNYAWCRFTAMSLNSSGGTNDALAFQRWGTGWGMQRIFEELPLGFYGIGDNAYPLGLRMLIPFSDAKLNSETKRAFNFYLSQLRIRIETAFGLLVNKWRIFKSPIQQGVEINLKLIVYTSMLLHNYVIDEQLKENDEYEVRAAMMQSEFEQYYRLKSFFHYLGIGFWKQVLLATNRTVTVDEGIASRKVVAGGEFELDELFEFLGLHFAMELDDKCEYSNYWNTEEENAMWGNIPGYTGAFSFSKIMSLTRFQQLRAALSFTTSVTEEQTANDPLIRIWPLINIVKMKAAKFIIPGREMSIDEASIACRSKFARFLIVFNPTKPSGKYHFRLYVLKVRVGIKEMMFRLNEHGFHLG